MAIQAGTVTDGAAANLDETLGVLSSANCDSLGQDADAWAKVVGALADYAKALEDLAGAKAIDFSGQLETARSSLAALGADSLGSDGAKVGVGAAAALAESFMKQWRRRELTTAVKDADPHVQIVADVLTAHIDDQLRMLEILELNILLPARALVTSPAEKDTVVCRVVENPDATDEERAATPLELVCDAEELRVTTAMSLFAHHGWIHERRLALTRMSNAVKVFSAAHAVLAQNAQTLGKQDAKHLATIAREIKDIYEKADAAVNPEP